ncbi:metallophosphoesterase [Bacillus solimangrovi]|uniref:Metallophosphoesterase n=2 Tax=Bacillus solimangrovi TaxID=1305675 RepID=A0A1E5LJF0_9BACI|nr:metallophosphoesterase [Bacillus solimangrovi]
MNRRNFMKRSFKLLINTIILTGGTYVYARYIEPRLIRTNLEKIVAPQIPESFDGLRILQFSDTHIGHNYTLDQFKRLVEKINEQSCDLVLFTGDLVDEPNNYDQLDQISPILSAIQAPLGKYAIFGNHDHGGYGTEIMKKVYEQSDFQLLMNERVDIYNTLGERIIIGGIDDAMLGHPKPELALQNVTEEDFAILLAHEPDIFAHLGSFHFHTQLSGHSHGGQVQLPFLGPLYTPPGAKKYYEGWYDHADNEKKLYVNRGIGTTREPYRFLSIPEITIFTLKRSEAS